MNKSKYDVVLVPCPQCQNLEEFHSYGGSGLFRQFTFLNVIPEDVMSDINHNAPVTCQKCKTPFEVGILDGEPLSIISETYTDSNQSPQISAADFLSTEQPEDTTERPKDRPEHAELIDHMISLKPCPLCLSHAEFVPWENKNWTIKCSNCLLHFGEPDGYASRLELSEKWNHRPKHNWLTTSFNYDSFVSKLKHVFSFHKPVVQKAHSLGKEFL